MLKIISTLFKPATDLIDDLTLSKEEKAELDARILETRVNTALKFMEYEQQLLESKTSIVVAEAQGGSWLQRSWRPITMLTFLALVVGDSFGLLATELAPEAWTLLQIGLGGYVVGRSVEKSMPHLKNIMNKQ